MLIWRPCHTAKASHPSAFPTLESLLIPQRGATQLCDHSHGGAAVCRMRNRTDSERSSRRCGLPRALRLNFDHSLVSPGVVGEIAFVNRQKQQAVASGIELGTPANENEIIVVRADHSDERSGRLVSYELLGIRQIGYSFRPRGSTARRI